MHQWTESAYNLMRFRRTNSNNGLKQSKNYHKAHGIVLERHHFSKRWRKTHEMRIKGQSPNHSNLEPEIKTKEIEEGWNNDYHQHCRNWGCLRVTLNAFTIHHGVVACPGIKEQHLSLGFTGPILYPRCPIHKQSYQVFTAGLLLLLKQLLMQVRDKNQLLSR